jgi:hypothetical protein
MLHRQTFQSVAHGAALRAAPAAQMAQTSPHAPRMRQRPPLAAGRTFPRTISDPLDTCTELGGGIVRVDAGVAGPGPDLYPG